MLLPFSGHRSLTALGAVALSAGATLVLAPGAVSREPRGHDAHQGPHPTSHPISRHHRSPSSHASPRHHGRVVGAYAPRAIASDSDPRAEISDPNLVNAWGLAFGPRTPAWIADMGTSKASVIAGAVNGDPATLANTFNVHGGPTGEVFNATAGFPVRSGDASGPSTFLFATVAGTIEGWNANVPAAGSRDAQTAVTVPGAELTGLAVNGDKLYAADFHNARVDVWDGSWQPVKRRGAFRDRRIPKGYAPFGIESVGTTIVVTYAQQDARAQLDVPGAGHGFVDVYSRSGRLRSRLAVRGTLNSPWGVALAPRGFGKASGQLLVGNFGDGRVNVFDPRDGRFEGQLGGADGKPLTIDGLWALKFGNGVTGAPNQLLFTAGPAGGAHGLFGELSVTTKGRTTPSRPTQPSAPTTPSTPVMPGGPYSPARLIG